MKQKIFALILILCGLCLNLKAETQGDIVGRVLDDSGAPLVGATVQMSPRAMFRLQALCRA